MDDVDLLAVLVNARGFTVELSSLGAAIASVKVPEERTVAAGGSAGKTIGRYANRIARGTFELDGVRYALATNENGNTLHGGPAGFSKRLWGLDFSDGARAQFSLHSPDGDQGFPGAMDCRVLYAWNDEGELRIDYAASSGKPTVVNFTNHVYFNLRGGGSVEDYLLQVPASNYTVVDSGLIPTGEIAPVDGTPRDFGAARALGAGPIDCCFAIDGWDGTLRFAARLSDPDTGRGIEVHSTQPGMQLYTGKPGAVALETQHFADAPNHPNFPSTVLRPGQTLRETTIYRFL